MLKKLLLLQFILLSLTIQSQKNTIESYEEYFSKSREIPYLHLNKTTFFKGENIWFQAYILEQGSKKLHAKTSNLYVSIYDDTGKLKTQQLVKIKNGIGVGNIKVDSSFTKKAYYLRASTKWMKNFSEDQSYSQKIKILQNKKQQQSGILENDIYDFQLLPEGGHLIANTFNRVGILIKNKNQKGISIKNGVVKDSKGHIIEHFTTNSFGIGEVFIYLKEKENYSFFAKDSKNRELKAQLTLIENKGITLNLTNDQINNNFILKISTNSNTISELNNKKFSFLVHNTSGYLLEYFTFNNKNLQYSFKLNKDILFEGINIVTVFNENGQPLLERMFFNDAKDINPKNIDVEIVEKNQDSLKIQIKNNYKDKIYFSTSFLPSETKSYNPDHSIISSFILKPFVKGNIQNPSYYFSNSNTEKIKNLDLLLLTQGWSKYDWNRVFNNPPQINYNFEKGIDYVFKLNRKIDPKKNFIIESEENNFKAKVAFINNTFKLDTSFFYKNSKVKFAINHDKDFFKIGPSLTFSGNSLYEEVKLNHVKELEKTIPEYAVLLFLEDDIIILDEISIKNKKKNKSSIKETQTRKHFFYNTYVTRFNLMDRRTYRYWGNNYYYFGGIGNSWGSMEIPPNSIIAYPNFEGSLYTIMHFYKKTYNEFYEIELPVGFAKPKEYYNPKYPSLDSDDFLNYGAIFWKPNLVIEANSIIEFQIDDKNQKEIFIFLEGISEKGQLISKKHLFKL